MNDEKRVRLHLQGIERLLIEEALCFLGVLGWLSFLGYTFAKAVFER